MASSNQDKLSGLPAELLALISSYLRDRDIKNLRLTNKSLWGSLDFRITRVYLSANSHNVNVFRAIADHDTFRKGVVELIWDDARLPRYPDDKRDDPDIKVDLADARYAIEMRSVGGAPRWFSRACEQNVDDFEACTDRNSDHLSDLLMIQQLADQLSQRELWAYYQTLLQQQSDVWNTDADVDALRYDIYLVLSPDLLLTSSSDMVCSVFLLSEELSFLQWRTDRYISLCIRRL